MPTPRRKEYKFPISPEKQRNFEVKKEAVETERVRIALRMMIHEETDFKISVYTGMSFKKIKYIRENMLEAAKESAKQKSETMERAMRMQDPVGAIPG